MLTFKQRYKPRTTREYTKSDLTVYDSAGNTALNALKVYGKSEIVEGVIKSVGEGYAVVDLGTLNWRYDTTRQWFISGNLKQLAKPTPTVGDKGNLLCPIYTTYSIVNMWETSVDGAIGINEGATLYIRNSGYTDPTAFKTAMSGVLLCYELADPSQGNAIAVKTDNGTGIDGTMATFTTGTPLYGIDENARDVMEWSGSSGVVTKKCGSNKLANLTWNYVDLYNNNTMGFQAIAPTNLYIDSSISSYPNAISTIYTPTSANIQANNKINKTIAFHSGSIKIIDTDYTTVEDFVASLGDAELVYELATPTTEPLTQAENESLASLRTFTTTTHFTNNANTDMTVNYTIRIPTV